MDRSKYLINLELVQVIPEKIRNTMFAEGQNSMDQVEAQDWIISEQKQIELKERDLAAISLIELIEENYPDLSQIDYGIVILGVGSNTSYKNFIKDIKSSNPQVRYHNNIFNSRNERLNMFLQYLNPYVVAPESKHLPREFDRNDLFGWLSPNLHSFDIRPNLEFNIKIFPYPLIDKEISYREGHFEYQLNGLNPPFLNRDETKPVRNHQDLILNILNKYLNSFYPHFHMLGHIPQTCNVVNSANFQKKYLKYKNKYLQLKNNF
jgi:hypothetical protein